MVFRRGNHSFVLFKWLQKDSSYFSKIFFIRISKRNFFLLFSFCKNIFFQNKGFENKKKTEV